MIQLRVKLEVGASECHLPSRKTEGAAGYDLSAFLDKAYELYPGERKLFSCGFSAEIPRGYEAQIRPRSGMALKEGITVLNTPGTIDSDYRGTVGVILINHSTTGFTINPGDRIAQMILNKIETPIVVQVQELDETGRGVGGFGHTGVK